MTACQAGLPGAGDRLRRRQRPEQPGREAEGERAELRPARPSCSTRPRTTYLAAVRNPNPEIPGEAGGGPPWLAAEPPVEHAGHRRPATRSPRVTDKISQPRPHHEDAASAGSSASAIAFCCSMLFLGTVTYLLVTGVGIWGVNIPVGWGFDIINFVWWIGIGHAGTLISAILLLLRQQWRTSINRFAEAMTLFAVACAGHLPDPPHGPAVGGAYWLLPYPNTMGLWPQLPQPAHLGRVRGLHLRHRLAALLVRRPDPRPGHAARPRAEHGRAGSIYGMLAMGWRGSARHWHNYETAYLLLAGLATPLVRLGAHRGELRLRGRRRSPAGTPRSSRPTSWPAPSTPASPWC